jgi:hypothetical protein
VGKSAFAVAIGGKADMAYYSAYVGTQSGHRECNANICYFYSSYDFDYLKDLKDVRGLTIAVSQASDADITGREALPSGVGG